MKTTVKELSNGLTLVLRESHAAPVVAFQMWVGVGAADEMPHEAGLAHVLEHMLFKGTTRRKVGQVAKDVERAGGYINAWTSHDETVFHVTMANTYAVKGLDVLCDAIQHSSLDEEELAKELPVILEEIRMGQDNPARMTTEKLFASMYRKHPYGRPVIGREEIVGSFTRKMVLDFYRRWYVPSNIKLVVVGDFETEKMERQIRSHLDKRWKGVLPTRDTRVREPAQRASRVVHGALPIGEVNVALGFPIPGLEHGDVPALDLLAAVLGQGASSRLETIIRRKHGLATDIRAISYTPKDMGVFGIFSSTPPHKLVDLVTAVSFQIERVRNKLISTREIEKARALLLSEDVYSEETVDGQAKKIGYYNLHATDPNFEQKYMAAIATIGPEQLLAVARKYLLSSKVNISTVLPDPAHRTSAAGESWISNTPTATIVESKIKAALLNAYAEGAKRRSRVRSKVATDETIIHEFPSGDTVLVRPDPEAKIVAARAAFLGGVRAEPARSGGLVSLLSVGLTRGTNLRTAVDIAEEMDTLACTVSGFSGRNTVGISGEFLSSNFPSGFALMGDCLRYSIFPEQEMAREKDILLEEIEANLDNSEFQVFHLFQKTLFGKHPYGRQMSGTLESVSRLVPSQVGRYLQQATGPSNMVLAVVGGANPDEVIELTSRYMLAHRNRGTHFKSPSIWTPPKGPVQVTKHMPKEQSHLVVGFPGTTLAGSDKYTMDVLIEILGGHGGRLFAAVREKRSLAYAVTAMSFEGMEPGYAALYAGTSPGQEQRVVDAMLKEVVCIQSSPPDKREFERVVQYLVGTKAITRQRASARAAGLSLGHLYGLGHDADDKYVAEIRKVTPAKVSQVAKQYLRSENMVISCVGPGVQKLKFV